MEETNPEAKQDTPTESVESKEGLQRTPAGYDAIRGVGDTQHEWVDRGIVDVPVKDLPAPEGVSSPADFDHHISWEDARSATQQLPEIQEQVKNGKTADDYSAEDQATGQDYSHGKRHVYDLYYGSDPVRLNKDGEQYDIVSGRHRVYAAQELGLSTIPARVIEKATQA